VGYSFTYASSWIETGIAPSPLMMPIRSGVYSFASLNEETYYGLPGMVADALPDKFGNAVIDAYMGQRGIDARSVTALRRIAQ
jgi:serine/threonine-protein kinase HipA